MVDTVKEMYATQYLPSNGTFLEMDVATGKFKTVPESGVLGRFVRAKILNGLKSRAKGAAVYDEVVFCQIKLASSKNKDIVSHKVAGVKGEELKSRFADAWKAFEELDKDAKKTADKK